MLGLAVLAAHGVDKALRCVGWRRQHAQAGALDPAKVHELKREYRAQGYVVVRQLLPAAEVASYDRALEQYKKDVVPTRSPESAFHDKEGVSASLK